MPPQAFSFQKVHGIQNLYRYSNGTFYARFIRSGKEYRRSLKTKDRETAKRELATLLGLRTSECAVTLGQLIQRHRASMVNLAPQTLKEKQGILRRIERDWPGGLGVLIRKIVPSQIQSFIARQRVGASHSNAFLIEFRQMFRLALSDKLLPANPAAELKWQKPKIPVRLTPTREQFVAIIADVRAQQFNSDARDSGDLLEAMGLLGLGQAELRALCVRDVDLERGRISVYRLKTSTPFRIPLYPQARNLVEKLCKDKRANDRIFVVKDAGRSLAGACRRLDLPRFTQRSFRRFFVSNALEAGVDVQTVARWQGHRDTKLILEIYGNVRAPHMDRMALLMK